MITSGCAAVTALSTASRSSPSTITGVAPWFLSWLALSADRVLAVTSWPAAVRLGTRYWPITPVAPATKTRIVVPPFAECPPYDAVGRTGVTLPGFNRPGGGARPARRGQGDVACPGWPPSGWPEPGRRARRTR